MLVSTYNWPEALEVCLLSMTHQTVPPNEILIADDGSTDETRKLIARISEQTDIPIHHVWHEDEGYRKSIILNKALARATSEYIIQIDGDIIIGPRFVEDHQQYATPGRYLSGSRALLGEDLTPRVLNNRDYVIRTFQKGIRRPWNALRVPWLAPLSFGSDLDFMKIRGCNTSYWLHDLLNANGFNESFTGWGREDSELAARLVAAGIRGRKLKFVATQHHLNHRREPLDSLERNDEIFRESVRKGVERCEVGVDQYR